MTMTRFYRILFALTILAFPALLISPLGAHLEALTLRFLVLAAVSVVGAWLFGLGWPGRKTGYRLAASALACGAAHQAAVFLPELSTYPLSMGWSETSRFYYGSLFLSESVYGVKAAPSVLHPTRYLLQAIPFLVPALPLWFHRLWQVALWLGLAALSAALLARRLRLADRVAATLVALWAFLFFFQGPVLYHLWLPVIVVLWGFDSHRPWRSLFVIGLASVWAGISRINWYPVPAFLGATLYLLERPLDSRPLWRYLAPPAAWTVAGVLIAFVSQAAYVVWSGNEAEQFGSSFTSDLLWYRLLPSATYPLGVIPAVTLASLPPALLILLYLRRHRRLHHPIRPLGLGTMLGVLLAGGLVVSAKIGGGSNLHNVDSYLILLAVIAVFITFDRFRPDPLVDAPGRAAPAWLLALGLIVPLGFALSSGGPLPERSFERAREVIAAVQGAVDEARPRGGGVLFISERHLLTFGGIQGVELIPDYEKVFLMEMAMSGNASYLGRLREQLQNREFGLIVSHPLRINYQGAGHPFGEENDAWVRGVAAPVLCYYQAVETYRDVGVQLLVPLPEAEDCE